MKVAGPRRTDPLPPPPIRNSGLGEEQTMVQDINRAHPGVKYILYRMKIYIFLEVA